MIIPRRRKRDSFLPGIQLLTDAVMTQAVLWACFWFRFVSGKFSTTLSIDNYAFYHRAFPIMTVITIYFIRSYGLYKPSRFVAFGEETARVVKAVVSSTLLLMAITFFIRGFTFSRTYLVFSGIALAVGVSFGRLLLGLFVMSIDHRRGSQRQVLIVGLDENAKKLVEFYRRNPRFSMRAVAILDNRLPTGSMAGELPVVGRIEDLEEYIKSHRDIHEVIVAAQGLTSDQILKMIYECEKLMVTFRWIADIFGLIASRMSVSHMGKVPLLSFSDSPLAEWENRLLKRFTDVVLSLFFLLILSPIFLIISLIVKFSSKGAIFYRQQRIGEDGRRFVLYKFRTMDENAEDKTGPVWAQENDPRRTGVGAFLRKNNLDELPQLWNVFIGNMSLVGPRPERPFFVGRFQEDIPRYMARHSIRSGITGWAQVNGLRGNTSIEERTKFDLYYIENWSLGLDLRILFRTLFARHNAY